MYNYAWQTITHILIYLLCKIRDNNFVFQWPRWPTAGYTDYSASDTNPVLSIDRSNLLVNLGIAGNWAVFRHIVKYCGLEQV